MSGLTSYQQKILLDLTLGLGGSVSPEPMWISLHTADPTDTGSFATEVSTSGSGYARQPLTASMNPTDAVTGISSSSALITFGPATADWGTITYIGFCNGVTAGTMKMSGALTQVQTTPIGESVQFSPAQLLTQLL